MAPNGNATPRHRRGVSRVIPELGTVHQDDFGEWTATTPTGRKLGTWRYRAEAVEALLLAAIFPDIVARTNGGAT